MISSKAIKYFLIALLMASCTGAPIIAQTLLTFPNWTTATRVGNTPGAVGFNTQTNLPEYLDNSAIWHSFAASGAFNIGVGSTSVSGGTTGFCLTDNGGIVGNVACGGTGTLVVGTTPITGGVNGDCLTVASGVLGIASCGSGGGVTQIIAGTGVTVSPGGGTGAVTVTATGVATVPGAIGQILSSNGSGGFGTPVTPSISAGCGNSASAGSIGDSLVGTITSLLVPVVLTGSNAPITTAYCGQLVRLNNGSAQTPTIAQAGSAGFPAGWYTTVCNIGAGVQTLTPGGGTIGGAASYALAAGSATVPVCVGITSDGVSDYNIIAGAGGSGGGVTTGVCGITVSGASATGTLTPVILTGSNVPITTGYCGELVELSNSGAQTPTIAEAGTTGFSTGWYATLCNINTGIQTLTPAAGTIGGAASLTIAAGTAIAPVCVTLASDGISNYDIVSSTSSGGATGANPTATIGTSAVNGSATTFMRSDGAPAIPQCSSSTFGACKVDGSTITATAGVISAVGGGGSKNFPTSQYVTSNWYLPAPIATILAGAAATAGTVYCNFGGVTANVTIKALSANPSASAGNSQLAIYSVSGGTLTYLDSTASTANSGSLSTTLVTNTTDALTAGTLYAFCINNSSTPTFTAVTSVASQGVLVGTATKADLFATFYGKSFASAYACSSSCTNGFPNTITLSAMGDVATAAVPAVIFEVN